MSVPGSADPPRPRPSVFLSYASEDRPAAQLLRDALLAFGLEALYDESSLVGGDAWDQKIRRQIRQCDFFMPVISANTEARPEGYFRREWRLAVERTLDMADDHVFLLPVVIDDTSDARARVPDKFLAVQWLKVPRGQPTAALEELCRRLISGETVVASHPPSRPVDQPDARYRPARKRPRPAPQRPEYPPFPREEPGQKTRFWFQASGWTFRWLWVSFNRLPKWVRICAYAWLGIALLQWVDSWDEHSHDVSTADAQKLKQISDTYQGSLSKADIAKLAVQIAREFSDGAQPAPGAQAPLLAIPFTAPAGDRASEKVADSTFVQVYGRLALSRHGHVGLTSDVPSSIDRSSAVELGRALHAHYVLYGAVDRGAAEENLTVSVVAVADSSVVWSKAYPIVGADAATIAAEVDSNMPKLEE